MTGTRKQANPFDPEHYRPESISNQTRAINRRIWLMSRSAVNWWETDITVARQARAQGLDGHMPVKKSPRARVITIPRPGGDLALRVIAPRRARGVYLHIHGGAWVLGASDQQDDALEELVRRCGMAGVSVEYRLAPEHKFPAALDDCECAARWLLENSEAEFGTRQLVIGGESAGANLSAGTLLRLRKQLGQTGFVAANLVCGAFDLGMTPSQRILGAELEQLVEMEETVRAYLPAGVDCRDPEVSPLYADLRGLPPALITVGTRDALLDDSLFLYTRWIAAGNEAQLAVYPGGAHGFTSFPFQLARDANHRIYSFVKKVIAGERG